VPGERTDGVFLQKEVAMQRILWSLLLVLTMCMGLVLPLRHGEATRATKPLMGTPVHGTLANGRVFHGQLTVHAVRVDPYGSLAAMGSVTGAVGTPGAATPTPLRSFTARVSLLDRRGPCTTVVVQPAPIVLTRLDEQVTLAPVILGVRAIPTPTNPWRATLCPAMALKE